MAVTLTRAAARDELVVRRAVWRATAEDVVLVAVSLVSVAVLFTSYLGRLTLASRTQADVPAATVNLNTVADAAALEPALAAAFDGEEDR